MAIEDKVDDAKTALEVFNKSGTKRDAKAWRNAVAKVLSDPDFNDWVNSDKRHLSLLEKWATEAPNKGTSGTRIQAVVDGVKATQLATAKAAAALREQKVQKTMNKLFR